MLNRHQLKDYRELRGLSTRQVAAYCNVTHALITMVERGQKEITEYNHEEICKGINLAYQAKKNGTLKSVKDNDTEKPAQKAATRKRKAENNE